MSIMTPQIYCFAERFLAINAIMCHWWKYVFTFFFHATNMWDGNNAKNDL